jgi:hypothetical protein
VVAKDYVVRDLAHAGVSTLVAASGPGPVAPRWGTSDFENNLRRERQMEGINAAKARGVYKGRKPSIKPDEVRRLRKGGLGATEIARKLGVGRASVYRVLMR